MPWIIEDTSEPEGENFVRKAPGGRTMLVELGDATVYRTRKLAVKEASKWEEWFMKATGETVSEDVFWANQTKVSCRPSTTLVLHEIKFDFIGSEPFKKAE